MTDAQRDAVLALHGIDTPPNRIAQIVGVGLDAVRRVVDPEYQQMRCEAIKRNRKPKRTVFKTNAERDSVELRKQIPPDTRTLTGRLLGDPLRGRSALDRKSMGAVK